MFFSALVLPATSFAAEQNPPAKVAAISPGAVIGHAFTVYGKISSCLANMNMGKPESCLASDGALIRKILTEVRELSAAITKNQARTEARFDRLENILEKQNLAKYIDKLNGLEKNSKSALEDWKKITVCMALATNPKNKHFDPKKKNCKGTNGHNSPLKDALSDLETDFKTQVGLLNKNIEEAVTPFTGSKPLEGKNSVAFTAWTANKNTQDRQVKAESQVGQVKAPVVTHQLATNQNFFIDYYAEVFQAYGFVMPLALRMEGRDKEARNFQDRVEKEVYDLNNAYSVASTVKKMGLPNVEDGQILVRMPNTKWAALFYNTNKPKLGEDRLGYAGVAALATTLNLYAPVSELRDTNPDSFPDSALYGVKHWVTTPLVCPALIVLNSCKPPYYVYQLSRFSGGTADKIFGVRPIDRRERYPDDEYKRPAGVHGVDMWDEYNHFITGPAEYQWDPRPLWEKLTTWKTGTGAWVLQAKDGLIGVRRGVAAPHLMKP